jgi:hypothetical protein
MNSDGENDEICGKYPIRLAYNGYSRPGDFTLVDNNHYTLVE